MTLREKIETIQAFERGEYVEVRTDKTVAGKWSVAVDPLWDWNNNDYRIKPKPKKVVVLETWLCKTVNKDDGDSECFFTVEANEGEMQSYFRGKYSSKAIKLLSTREVEL